VTQGQNDAAGDDRRRDHVRNLRTREPPPSPQQPPRPSDDVRPAQCGPCRKAGTASATSHSGPNSSMPCMKLELAMVSATTARISPRARISMPAAPSRGGGRS
jgi:hypothetical protein